MRSCLFFFCLVATLSATKSQRKSFFPSDSDKGNPDPETHVREHPVKNIDGHDGEYYLDEDDIIEQLTSDAFEKTASLKEALQDSQRSTDEVISPKAVSDTDIDTGTAADKEKDATVDTADASQSDNGSANDASINSQNNEGERDSGSEEKKEAKDSALSGRMASFMDDIVNTLKTDAAKDSESKDQIDTFDSDTQFADDENVDNENANSAPVDKSGSKTLPDVDNNSGIEDIEPDTGGTYDREALMSLLRRKVATDAETHSLNTDTDTNTDNGADSEQLSPEKSTATIEESEETALETTDTETDNVAIDSTLSKVEDFIEDSNNEEKAEYSSVESGDSSVDSGEVSSVDSVEVTADSSSVKGEAETSGVEVLETVSIASDGGVYVLNVNDSAAEQWPIEEDANSQAADARDYADYYGANAKNEGTLPPDDTELGGALPPFDDDYEDVVAHSVDSGTDTDKADIVESDKFEADKNNNAKEAPVFDENFIDSDNDGYGDGDVESAKAPLFDDDEFDDSDLGHVPTEAGFGYGHSSETANAPNEAESDFDFMEASPKPTVTKAPEFAEEYKIRVVQRSRSVEERRQRTVVLLLFALCDAVLCFALVPRSFALRFFWLCLWLAAAVSLHFVDKPVLCGLCVMNGIFPLFGRKPQLSLFYR